MNHLEWLDTKQNGWSANLKYLMDSFTEPIIAMIDELKEEFNLKSDPDRVHKFIADILLDSFDSLNAEFKLSSDEDAMRRFWKEFTMVVYMMKDTFFKMSSEQENFAPIFKLLTDIFSKISKHLTKKVGTEFHDCFKDVIDDTRVNISDFLLELKKQCSIRISDVDAESIFDMSGLDNKQLEIDDITPGDDIRYYQSDESENIAFFSYNQEGLEDAKVRLTSKKDGENFEIDIKNIIEILPTEKSIEQEVSDKIKKMKDDGKKVKMLNDFLDELNENLNTDITINKMSLSDSKHLFSDGNFLERHKRNMTTILRSVYSPLGKWDDRKGIVDLEWETSKGSILNKLINDSLTFTILVNDINDILSKNSSLSFTFKNVNKESDRFHKEYQKFIRFLYKHKEKIFLKKTEKGGSEILNKIIASINGIIKQRKDILSLTDKIEILIPGVSGIEIDLSDDHNSIGIIKFEIDGNAKSLLYKMVSSISFRGGYYEVKGIDILADITADYIVLGDEKEFTLFEYDPSHITTENEEIRLAKSLMLGKINKR